jgi:restriction system protein
MIGAGPAVLIGIVAAGLAKRQLDKHRAETERRRRQLLADRIWKIVSPHVPALVRKHRQLKRVDEYGLPDDKRWFRELDRFCEGLVYPGLGVLPPPKPHGMKAQPRRGEVERMVDSIISEVEQRTRREFADQFNREMTPLEYEEFCACRLREAGWVATVTKATGDQGADIVANRGTETLVVQCKHYTSPVGHKAVQEIVAATRHYSAQKAAVVTSGSYTASARELACTNNVLLLSHDDIVAALA